MEFPHMKDSNFPHIDSVDVYKYKNEFDYSRFDDLQMQVQVCCVPWDMGEAHIGARTISGIGNIVHFGSKEKRDKWFDSIPDNECFRWETKYKELHRDNEIVVPLPFDVATKYNYIVVSYNLFANDDSLVEYENADGLRKWFWFIREVEFVAPNATKLHILNDAWQTFIYDVHITSMILERGHAPMFATNIDNYLAAPAANCAGLLERDIVSENASYKQNTQDPLIIDDGEMYVCFLLTAERNGWGEAHTQSWKTPAGHYNITDGVPNFAQIAVPIADYRSFMQAIESEHANWKETVQAVYIASEKIISIANPFTIGGITAYSVNGKHETERLLELDKSMFGYPTRYANITKLYTYPYAYIATEDENGNVYEIRIEEMTSNVINCGYAFNAIMNGLNLNAKLLGVGDGATTISFKNLSNRTCIIGGKALDLQYDWAIPTFAIIQQASRQYDFSGFFDRAQATNDANTAYSNATASAATAKANADRSADTAKANADASADTSKANVDRSANTQVANAALQTSTNTAIRTANNTLINATAALDEILNEDNQLAASNLILLTTNNQVAATEQQAAIAAASGAATSAIGAISSAATGDVAGAITSLLGGGVQAASTIAQASTAVNLTTSQADASRFNNEQQETAATYNLLNKADSQIANANDVNSSTNSLITSSTANSAATMKSNASASQTTEKANASRSQSTAKTNAAATQTTDNANATRTKDNALEARDNTTRQRGLQAPFVYSSFNNVENATIKPKMIVPYVMTQGVDAIQYAGDEFLRYGYMYNRQWNFDTWHIGKYFTYWKLSDFWVTGLNVPDMYMDKLRFFLYGGVTIWRKPEDIGNVSIYENGV